MLLSRPFGGQKNGICNRKCMKSFCKIVLPAEAGTTFLKTCDAKSELKHEKHKRCSLKLAFLMHIRNHVLSEQFYCFLLGTGYCFCKIIKSAPWSFWSGRAECAGALGGDMRGVCDLQIWDLQLRTCALDLTRQLLPYGKGGGFNRSAHSARPSHRQWELRHGKWEMRNENPWKFTKADEKL